MRWISERGCFASWVLLEADRPFENLSVGVVSVDDDRRVSSSERDESIIHRLRAGSGDDEIGRAHV